MAPAKSIGTVHYVAETAYKADKARITANFNGIVLDTKIFDPQKDARKPDFLAKNPIGKVPFLETDMGCVCTSNAIARFVARCRADTSLYGRSFADEGNIDTWMEFCTYELEIPLMTWVYPVMGLMEDAPAATKDAQPDVKKAFTALEAQLKVHPYLIGDFITVADIVVVAALREGMTRVIDPAFRKPFPKVCAWFEKCCGLPQFKKVFGDVKLCAQAAKPQPVLPAFKPVVREAKATPAPVTADKAKKAQPEAKKAQPSKAAAPAPSAAGAGGASEAEIKAVGDKIRDLKEKLKGEGLSGKKINDHEEVKSLVAKLQDLKARAEAAPPAPAATNGVASAAPAGGGDLDAQIKAVGDSIRQLKEKLKADGLSGKQINDNGDVKSLVAQLQELKSKSADAPAAAAPAPAAKASPKAKPAASPKKGPAPAPAAAGGDVEGQVKAVGDQIRVLKEKLKGEGLSGKKINEHAEVKKLVEELQKLKAQL